LTVIFIALYCFELLTGDVNILHNLNVNWILEETFLSWHVCMSVVYLCIPEMLSSVQKVSNILRL